MIMIGQNAGKCLLPPLASDPTNAHGVFRKQFVEQRNCNKKGGVMMMVVVQWWYMYIVLNLMLLLLMMMTLHSQSFFR